MNEYNLPVKAISYNAYYRIFRNRYVISKEGKQFRQDMIDALNMFKTVCHDTPVKMTIEMTFDDKRKRDLDNTQKSIIDACKGILYKDDCLIYELCSKKLLGQPLNSIKITIEKLNI